MAKTANTTDPAPAMRPRADVRIGDVAQRWFLIEPLLFSMYCTQTLTENQGMKIPLRTGNGKIEYCARLIDEIDNRELADRLKVEALRIVLKHPYQRQPFRARPEILYLASNMTILDNMGGPKAFCFELVPQWLVELLPKNKTFEEYYGLLNRLFPQQKVEEQFNMMIGMSNDDSDSGAGSAPSPAPASSDSTDSSQENQKREFLRQMEEMKAGAALWLEDSIMSTDINIIIQTTIGGSSKGWGTIPGGMVECIKASLVPPINVANLLKGFKKTILSNKRQLTRMRPSRRYGFEQMGSKYAYTTRVLVGLDVSGSVESEMLGMMLGMVNRIFKQGIEHIDVIQFDAQLQGKPVSLRRAINTFHVTGRGGTNFQPLTDFYLSHPEYDGLIFITDGLAPDPVVPPEARHMRPVSWIITDDDLIPSIRNGWPK